MRASWPGATHAWRCPHLRACAPPSHQGVAHLVEHVTFLGSKKRESLLGTGARANAYTDFHHTVFHVHAPLVNGMTGGPMLPQVRAARGARGLCAVRGWLPGAPRLASSAQHVCSPALCLLAPLAGARGAV